MASLRIYRLVAHHSIPLLSCGLLAQSLISRFECSLPPPGRCSCVSHASSNVVFNASPSSAVYFVYIRSSFRAPVPSRTVVTASDNGTEGVRVHLFRIPA
ncbi:hypothetical protein BJ508DRAFT_54384 [Ascobolus immersus RN42]|uniref:Uncharacterized protein n=1 Tax=Ascobolus immersus RN42 TaxID=1160509 RepID=A0A3N4HJV2_ASCIM|nr:hypothetical protein BJ508DRAFT_54384 [Ascobolus immersus RN42]